MNPLEQAPIGKTALRVTRLGVGGRRSGGFTETFRMPTPPPP